MTTHNEIFRNFIAGHELALPFLPVVHTTTVTGFGEILQNNKLRLNLCRYYKKRLLYLFYGKPVYRLRRGSDLITRLLGDAAVCFVLNTIKLPGMHRAFALDTGASFGHRYDDYLPEKVSIDDFEIAANPDTVAKLVKAFFGENEKYVSGSSRRDINFSALDRVSEVYNAIASSTVSKLDERACTCELQYDAELEINKESIHTVVIPDTLFGEKQVQKKMKEWGVRPITYRMRRAELGARTEVIFEKLGDYYKKMRQALQHLFLETVAIFTFKNQKMESLRILSLSRLATIRPWLSRMLMSLSTSAEKNWFRLLQTSLRIL